ncbi:uncharacterized protein LOC111830106 isoform X3 [Capsella rubella]|uniref:uncharacterized protein LOC111830106 isoform X3 n=1 Tax=Capsella rubella TaxID=81985 RepID=UPI000CD5C621|nr:uncharacterized protein LOC111830106 isoform X3 [Capsella rubella]
MQELCYKHLKRSLRTMLYSRDVMFATILSIGFEWFEETKRVQALSVQELIEELASPNNTSRMMAMNYAKPLYTTSTKRSQEPEQENQFVYRNGALRWSCVIFWFPKGRANTNLPKEKGDTAIHIYADVCIHTCIHVYILESLSIHVCKHTCIHVYNPYMHTFIHYTFMCAYFHTFMRICFLDLLLRPLLAFLVTMLTCFCFVLYSFACFIS